MRETSIGSLLQHPPTQSDEQPFAPSPRGAVQREVAQGEAARRAAAQQVEPRPQQEAERVEFQHPPGAQEHAQGPAQWQRKYGNPGGMVVDAQDAAQMHGTRHVFPNQEPLVRAPQPEGAAETHAARYQRPAKGIKGHYQRVHGILNDNIPSHQKIYNEGYSVSNSNPYGVMNAEANEARLNPQKLMAKAQSLVGPRHGLVGAYMDTLPAAVQRRIKATAHLASRRQELRALIEADKRLGASPSHKPAAESPRSKEDPPSSNARYSPHNAQRSPRNAGLAVPQLSSGGLPNQRGYRRPHAPEDDLGHLADHMGLRDVYVGI